VAKIPRENDGSAGGYCGRDDMAIIRVGQVHGRDTILVAADYRRRRRLVHQSARGLEALHWNSWRVDRQVPDPFVVDHVCPTRFNNAIYGSVDDDVPEVKRIKNAGVEDRDRGLKRHGVA
jgi:hypothetical protein